MGQKKKTSSFKDKIEQEFAEFPKLKSRLLQIEKSFVLTQAEQYFIFNCISHGSVSFKTDLYEKSAINASEDWGKDREIRLVVLREVIRLILSFRKDHLYNLHISNIKFVSKHAGEVNFSELNLEIFIYFKNCYFNGPLIFENGKSNGLSFEECRFAIPFEEKSYYSIDVSNLQVKVIDFDSCFFEGGILANYLNAERFMLYGSFLRKGLEAGGVNCNYFYFRKSLSNDQLMVFKGVFTDFEISNSIVFSISDSKNRNESFSLIASMNAVSRQFSLFNSFIFGGLKITKGHISNLLIDKSLIHQGNSLLSLDTENLSITDGLSFYRESESVSIEKTVEENFSVEVNSYDAETDEDRLSENFFPKELLASYMKIKGHYESDSELPYGEKVDLKYTIRKNYFIGEVSFDGSKFQGNVDFSSSVFISRKSSNALDLQTCHLQNGTLYLNNGKKNDLDLTFYGDCNLNDSFFDRIELSMDPFCEENEANRKELKPLDYTRLKVSGLTYNFISQSDGKKIENKNQLVDADWMYVNGDSDLSQNQPFEELARFYNRIGGNDTARKVRVNRRRFIKGGEQSFGALLRVIVKFTVPPYNALRSLGFIFLLNFLVLELSIRIKGLSSLVISTYTSSFSTAPKFNTALYIVERLVPFIDLDLANHYWLNSSHLNRLINCSSFAFVIALFMLLAGVSNITRKAS